MSVDGASALIGTFHLVGDDVEACFERSLSLLGVAVSDAPSARLRIADERRRPGRYDHHGRQGGWVYLADDGTLTWPLAVQLARLAQSPVLALVVRGKIEGEQRSFSWDESLVSPDGKRVAARPSATGWMSPEIDGLPAELHQALAEVVTKCSTFWTRGEVERVRSLDLGVLPTTGSPQLDEVLGHLRFATRVEVREEPGRWLLRIALPDGRTVLRGVSDEQLERIREVGGDLF